MKLHQLGNAFVRRPRKRVGRGDGSGHGRTSGRGEKGAGARSGTVYRAHFEGGQIPFFRRLPKRGFSNPNRATYNIINLKYLEENFVPQQEVNITVLDQRGMIRRPDRGLKVLGDGELTKPLTVAANKFSASARKKIEAAGGVCKLV
jgi:large subunit ribosomal protein L15